MKELSENAKFDLEPSSSRSNRPLKIGPPGVVSYFSYATLALWADQPFDFGHTRNSLCLAVRVALSLQCVVATLFSPTQLVPQRLPASAHWTGTCSAYASGVRLRPSGVHSSLADLTAASVHLLVRLQELQKVRRTG